VGERAPAPFDVIESVARERHAPLVLKGHDFTYTASGEPLHPQISYRGPRVTLSKVPLGLAGMHQVENAAIALALVETIHARVPVSSDDAVRGLADARWPCRLERVLDNPPVYIDVAHNPAGIQRLVESMPRCVVVFAASSDKNVGEMLRGLQPIAKQIILTEFDGARALPLAQLQIAAGNDAFESRATLEHAIALGLKSATPECPLLITGSIFTAAQARHLLIRTYGAAKLQF
jgi:dihydrofolate synthase/folylpolyglutamate synthase